MFFKIFKQKIKILILRAWGVPGSTPPRARVLYRGKDNDAQMMRVVGHTFKPSFLRAQRLFVRYGSNESCYFYNKSTLFKHFTGNSGINVNGFGHAFLHAKCRSPNPPTANNCRSPNPTNTEHTVRATAVDHAVGVAPRPEFIN